MKSLLSTTSNDNFKDFSWHNGATHVFWGVCSEIRLNNHGKLLKTVLNSSLGVYRSRGVRKGTDLGCLIFKVCQSGMDNIEDSLLVSPEILDALKSKLATQGMDMDFRELNYKADGKHWGYAIIVPVVHISDIKEIRAKKMESPNF